MSASAQLPIEFDVKEVLAIRFCTRHGNTASGHISDFFGMRLYERAI